LLPASPEEVFDMWLNPDSFRRWMRPSDADLVYVELHPFVGGSFRFDLQEKDGRVVVHTGQYLDIQRPHKLQFTWNSTVLGDRLSQVTVEFHEQANHCLLVLLHDLPEDDATFADHERGWTLILERLADAQGSNRA
jgi:uncharacterized protein YndB with AHSA1/START domain